MRALALYRYHFTGMMYLPKVDTASSGGDITYVYEKDIVINFTGDPSTPRSVVLAAEPIPTTARILQLRNKYDEEIMPGAEYTVTSTEPLINMFGRVELFRHQVALSNAPDFGYDLARV